MPKFYNSHNNLQCKYDWNPPPTCTHCFTGSKLTQILLFSSLELILEFCVFMLATCARSPTYIKVGFCWAAASPHPTARRGEVKDSIVFKQGAPGGRWWVRSPAEQAKPSVMLPSPLPLYFQCTFLPLQYSAHTHTQPYSWIHQLRCITSAEKIHMSR